MARSGNISGIIPMETELNLDGFFLGQLVCPKRDHIARWNVAKVSFFSGLDLSIGLVLNLVDIQTGSIYQELPGYVDFLVSQPILEDEDLAYGELVSPKILFNLPDANWPTWLIGSVLQGGSDRFNKNGYIILGFDAQKSFFAKKEQLLKVVRVESSF